MNKQEPPRIDETDKRILSILHTHGRISMTELGKQVHLSGQAVKNRLERLSEIGVVNHYTVNINCPVYGHKVHVLIRLQLTTLSVNQFTQLLRSSQYHIIHYYKTTGAFPLVLDAYFIDETQLTEFLHILDEFATYEISMIIDDQSLTLAETGVTNN